MEKCNLCSFWSLVCSLKTSELHELLAIVEYFLFAVLVALYEEPEKPDSALEYPFSLLSLIYWDFLHSTASASWGDLDRLILKLCIENMTFLNAFYLIIPFSRANRVWQDVREVGISVNRLWSQVISECCRPAALDLSTCSGFWSLLFHTSFFWFCLFIFKYTKKGGTSVFCVLPFLNYLHFGVLLLF